MWSERIRAWVMDTAMAAQKEFMGSRVGRRPGCDRGDGAEWSDLVLRVRTEGDRLSIDWLRRIWVKRVGGRKWMRAERIRKQGGASMSHYRKWDLKRYAKDWEFEEVWRMECRMAVLRQMWRLNRMMVKLEREYAALSGGVEGEGGERTEAPSDGNVVADEAAGFIPQHGAS